MAENDHSVTIGLYCRNCDRRTEHFGDVTPEGEVVFFQCLRCGAIVGRNQVALPTLKRAAEKKTFG